VSDGWPDCRDGSDESDLMAEVGGAPRVFRCLACAGVILPAAHLCRASGRGVTEECVQGFIGEKGLCNECVKDFVKS